MSGGGSQQFGDEGQALRGGGIPSPILDSPERWIHNVNGHKADIWIDCKTLRPSLNYGGKFNR